MYGHCLVFGTADSPLADLFGHLSMWWAQRAERRLAVRRYRLELKAARRFLARGCAKAAAKRDREAEGRGRT